MTYTLTQPAEEKSNSVLPYSHNTLYDLYTNTTCRGNHNIGSHVTHMQTSHSHKAPSGRMCKDILQNKGARIELHWVVFGPWHVEGQCHCIISRGQVFSLCLCVVFVYWDWPIMYFVADFHDRACK